MPRPGRKSRRLKLAGLVLMVATVLFVVHPPIIQTLVRCSLKAEAARHGMQLRAERIEGSVWEPIAIYGIDCEAISTAANLRVKVARLDASFSALALVTQPSSWWQKLVLDGADVTITVDDGTAPGAPNWALSILQRNSRGAFFALPAAIAMKRGSVTFVHGRGSVTLKNVRFDAAMTDAGPIRIGSMQVDNYWMAKKFEDVSGWIGLSEGKFLLSNLRLDDRITLEAIAVDPSALGNRCFEMNFIISAFDGDIRGELAADFTKRPLHVEATSWFSQISLASVADFLDAPEAAGGVIEEGKFMYSGAPTDPQQATLSARLQASDFRWGERRWNALILGATLVDQRLQVHEFQLKQVNNELTLSGEISLADKQQHWWESEFSCNISARVKNLTELSTLLGPDFSDASGEVTVDGSVRGRDQSFHGQIIASGNAVSFRGSNIDQLHAAVKLNGNEVQLLNCELIAEDDFLRARGVVNILGEKRYWAEVKGSIQELTRYSSLLHVSHVPLSLGGTVSLDWSGVGMTEAHSGMFRLKGKKIVRAEAVASSAIPLDAEFEATYSPGNIFFNRFIISEGDTVFQAGVTASARSLHLASIRLDHGPDLWLSGDLLLPVDVWTAWQKGSLLQALDRDGAFRANVCAHDLELARTLRLTGSSFPFRGVLDGYLESEGVFTKLRAAGRIQVSEGTITLGNCPSITDLRLAATADGDRLGIESLTGSFTGGTFSSSGTITIANLYAPVVDLAIQGSGINLQPGGVLARTAADFDLNVVGPLRAAQLSGTVRPTLVELTGDVTPEVLLGLQSESRQEVPGSVGGVRRSLQNWTLAVAIQGEADLIARSRGTLLANLVLQGSAGAPLLSGTLAAQGIVASTSSASFAVDEAVAYFVQPNPGDPFLDLRGSGTVGGHDFSACRLGPLSEASPLISADPTLPPGTIEQLLSQSAVAPMPGERRDQHSAMIQLQHFHSVPSKRLLSAGLSHGAAAGPLSGLDDRPSSPILRPVVH